MEGQQAPQSIEDRLGAVLNPEPEAQPQEAAEAPSEERPSESDGEEVVASEAPDGDVTEDDGDEEAITLSSISDLTEHFELDPEDLYNLTVPVTVGGKRQDVSLSEWKDSYVSVQEAKRSQEEAKALREQIEDQKRQSEEQYQFQLAQGAALVQSLEQQALARFEGINWQQLRADDPSEWSAKMTELQAAKQQLEATRHEVRSKIEEFQSKQRTQQQQTLEEHLQKERDALLQAWPEMGDEKTAAPEREALTQELKSRGFTDQEIGTASDHRILLLARDAMRYRQSASKADASKKKVVKIAKKVLKPGAKQGKAEQAQDREQTLRQKLRKSGHTNDAAALISMRLQG